MHWDYNQIMIVFLVQNSQIKERINMLSKEQIQLIHAVGINVDQKLQPELYQYLCNILEGTA